MTGSVFPLGVLTDLTTFLSMREKKRMAPSEHPMASRLMDNMGMGFEVGKDRFRWDCVISTRLFVCVCVFVLGCVFECVCSVVVVVVLVVVLVLLLLV